MNKGRYVFRQMCDFLPSDKIEWIIEKYNGDRYTKTFSCWQHLLVMILAQLWQSRSLRVLVNVLNSQKAKLYQMGIGKGVSRSTLAWANEHRDYRIFEEMESGTLLQMNQTASIHQSVLWDLRECCENPDLLCYHRILPCRYPRKEDGTKHGHLLCPPDSGERRYRQNSTSGTF